VTPSSFVQTYQRFRGLLQYVLQERCYLHEKTVIVHVISTYKFGRFWTVHQQILVFFKAVQLHRLQHEAINDKMICMAGGMSIKHSLPYLSIKRFKKKKEPNSLDS